MSASVEFQSGRASVEQVAEHLLRCDGDFVPPLSERVEIAEYANKIASKAMRFEAWSGDELVGLVAAYCNDREKCIAYITSVSVLREWQSKGIASNLVGHCIEYAKASGMRQISLEVAGNNVSAIRLYKKFGFVVSKATNVPFVAANLYFPDGSEKYLCSFC